jgi:hypothetical protein
MIGTSNPPHWSNVVLAQIEPDQSGAPLFLLSDSLVQPPARAMAMTAQSELSASGFVVIVLDDDLAVRNSLNSRLRSRASRSAATPREPNCWGLATRRPVAVLSSTSICPE